MQKLSFSEDFQRAMETWRRKHGLREDDAVLLCVELFRIHQEHWDRMRREEMPAFQEFRDSILKLGDTAKIFQRQSGVLLDELRLRATRKTPRLKNMLVACVLATGAGVLIGKFLL